MDDNNYLKHYGVLGMKWGGFEELDTSTAHRLL